MKNISFLSLLLLLQLTSNAQGYRTDNSSRRKSNRSNSSSGQNQQKSNLGKNILSFSPIQIFLTNVDQTTPDAAVQVSYERVLKNEIVSFKLPVSFILDRKYYYFSPTLKLYPMGQGVAKYAVGPQFLIGLGKYSYQESFYNQNTNTYVTNQYTIDRKQLAFMINNSINFTVAKAFFVSLDAGLGIFYYDNIPKGSYYTGNYYSGYGNNSNIQPAFQVNFAMGYRF